MGVIYRKREELLGAHRISKSIRYNFQISTETHNRILPVNNRKKRSILVEKYIETLVVADYLLFKDFKARNRDLELFILSIFNMVLTR